MEGEVWAVINKFPTYWISSQGRVLNIKSGMVLKPYCHRLGYQYVMLCNKGKRLNAKVHRLVAEAFVTNPCGYPEVNHIDEDKSNNKSINLELVTSQMNIEYSHAKEYTFISPQGKVVNVFNMYPFAKKLGLKPSPFYRVWYERAFHYHGWRKYVEGMKPTKFEFASYTFLSPSGEEVTTSNMEKLAKKFNLDRSSLSRVQTGRARSHKGWTCPGVEFIGRNKTK